MRGLIASVAAACVAVSLLQPTIWGEVAYFGAYIPLCVLSWRVVCRRPRTIRRPWLLVALTSTLNCLADVFTSAAWYLWDPARPAALVLTWAAHLSYVCGYTTLAVAVVMMVRRRTTDPLRPAFLDVATLVTAVFVVAWKVLIAPTLRQESLSPNDVMGAFYPLFDVTLIACVLLLILAPSVEARAVRMLIASATVILIFDLANNILGRWLSPEQGARLMGLLLLGNALLVLTVVHPDSNRLGAVARYHRRLVLHPARTLLLGVALVTAPISALIEARSTTSERVVLAVATIICTGLVLTRVSGALRAQDRAQQQLAHQAEHDPLTGLLNRRTVEERLSHLLEDADGRGVALLYIDLDGFKAINDDAGHDAGDAILVEVARRLAAAVRSDDLLARLGGDEFVVVCTDVPPEDGGRCLADRLLHDLGLPVRHGDAEHRVGASIGIAWEGAPAQGEGSAQRLLRAADMAMYVSKREGRGQWTFTEAAQPPAPRELRASVAVG